MAKVVTSYGNFSKGRIDHDMMGRYDLPIYNTGADVFENFISNYKGNAIYSAGFLSQIAFQDCEFIEFKFGNTQNYLCLFYANAIKFLAFDTNGVFGYVVTAPNTPLVVATPYTLAQCHTLDYTQNNDVMVVTCVGLEPRKLIRTAANAFTFNTFARLNDPFPTTYAATVNITAITKANPAAVTTATHGLTTGDRVLFAGVAGMTQINGYTAAVTVTGTTTFTVDLDTTQFSAYSSGGTIAKVTGGDYPACCLFYKGRLYYAATPLHGTKVWFSRAGVYDDFTLDTTLTDASPFNFTIADITQKIEWLFPGDNSLIVGSTDGIVAVNGGSVNTAITAATVQANITSAEPTNGAYPIKKDGLIFYIDRTGRRIYYFKYDIITEAFLSKDANLVAYDITRGGLTKLRARKDKNDLIISLRGDGAVTTCNFQESENINGWHERFTQGSFQDIAVMGDNLGNPQFFGLVVRNGTFYVEQQAPYMEFVKRDDFFTQSDDTNDDGKYKEMDDEAYNRALAEQLRGCIYLDGALTFQDFRTSQLTYDPIAGTITSTASDFTSGDVGKHIVYKTETGYESGRFKITAFTSGTVVVVDVLQDPKQIFDDPLYVWSAWYKTFITLSGLGMYNGTTIGVVTDGGFLEELSVSGGSITLPTQTASIVVGYRYTGVIKTFCLGFSVQGNNTQTTLKNLVRAGVRCVASAGLRIGSSRYDTQPVQELSQNDLNYLPPLVIDGTKYLNDFDENEEDKFIYLIQDQPLPATVTCLFIEANYALQS